MRIFMAIVVLAVLGTAGAWVMAGRAEGPAIEVLEPSTVGQVGQVEVALGTPGAKLTQLSITVEQNGEQCPSTRWTPPTHRLQTSCSPAKTS